MATVDWLLIVVVTSPWYWFGGLVPMTWGTALDAASALIGCVECAPCDPVSGTEATSIQCTHRLGKVAVPIRPGVDASVVP